jgi:hypothetical protein
MRIFARVVIVGGLALVFSSCYGLDTSDTLDNLPTPDRPIETSAHILSDTGWRASWDGGQRTGSGTQSFNVGVGHKCVSAAKSDASGVLTLRVGSANVQVAQTLEPITVCGSGPLP